MRGDLGARPARAARRAHDRAPPADHARARVPGDPRRRSLIGILAGVIAAVRRGKVGGLRGDERRRSSGSRVPHFWLGLMMIIFFAVDLHWLPAGGYVPFRAGPDREPRAHADAGDRARHRASSAVLMRQMRSSMLELARRRLRAHRAREGPAASASVVGKHALRNSLITVTTVDRPAARRADLGRRDHRADLRHPRLRPADARRRQPARLRAAAGGRARRRRRATWSSTCWSTSSYSLLNPRIRVAGATPRELRRSRRPPIAINPRARRRRLLRKRFLRRPLAVARARRSRSRSSLAAIFAPWIAPYSPSATDFNAVLAAPFARTHLLGTDELGRDMLLAPHLGRARVDPGGRARDAARDG